MKTVKTVSEITFGHLAMMTSVFEAIAKAERYDPARRMALKGLDMTVTLDEFDNVVLTVTPTLEV